MKREKSAHSKGLYAIMDIYADVANFDPKGGLRKPLADLIAAFEEVMKLRTTAEENFIFEHAYHHCGVTLLNGKKISKPKVCAPVKKMVGR